MIMKEEINQWLQGSRDYHQGVALYFKYGRNPTLKKKFQRKENTMFRQKLEYELAKLAGYSTVPVKKKSKPSLKQNSPSQPPGKSLRILQGILPPGRISPSK